MSYYENFMNELQERICRTLGIAKSDMEFVKKDEKKPSQEDRLMILVQRHGEVSESCCIHTQKLFHYYQTNVSMQQIVQEISERLCDMKNKDIYNKTKDIEDYEKVKSKLFIRLLNAERHADELRNIIYRQIGDIALTLCLKISDNDKELISTKISRYVFDNWEKDENEVIEAALANTYHMSSPRLLDLDKFILNFNTYKGEDFMNEDCQLDDNTTGNVLTTVSRNYGAVALFLPGVAERIANLLNSDFYAVFTSCHEAMIHSAATSDVETLSEAVTSTIDNATSEEDFLSYKVYRYSKEDGICVCN